MGTEQASCVLRLYGAAPQEVRKTADALMQQTKHPLTAAHCRSKGAETLVALHAGEEKALRKAAQTLREHFPAEVYAEGGCDLAAALVQALCRHRTLLTCADAAAGALLEQRLEAVPQAENVFDFGRLSYAEERTAAQIDQMAHRRAKRAGELPLAMQRARAARKLVGADFGAACVEREDCVTVLVGSKKGCWLRTVRRDDAPALWLLDIIRRAVCGLPQAEGTFWLRYRDAVPQAAMLPPEQGRTMPKTEKPRKKHWLRKPLLLVFLVVAAAITAGWYYTGGNLTALPQLLQRFPLQDAPGSGARLI